MSTSTIATSLPEIQPSIKVLEADDFLKTQVYRDSDLTFNDIGKLIAVPDAKKRKDAAVVTLTFAQSFDAKIAGKNGKQIQLSGPESSVMTHRLRAMHSHIMVGIGTVLNDNPQLNCRLPELLPLEQQPIPCILDSTLRTPPDCKLIQNAKAGIGHFPIILARGGLESECQAIERRRGDALRAAGCTILYTATDNATDTHKVPLEAIVRAFSLKSSHSLMIEGGAGVISTVLSTYATYGSCHLDKVIVTIAPTFVGDDGVAIKLEEAGSTDSMQPVASRTFGRDVVIAYNLSAH